MTAGIVGLGLISGSMAKAYAAAGHTVYAHNRNRTILDFAILDGAVTAPLDEKTIKACEVILVGLPPEATIDWVKTHAPQIAPKTIVIDLCGTKRVVCEALFPVAEAHGFTFVGGHPMAGTHNSGFKYAKETLFKGAPMVLCPPSGFDMELLTAVKRLLAPAGFGKFSVTTPDEHDKMIAFTSQMCHVVSNAYIKSPTARLHRGFSAGSYKDLTRVAWLNPDMWAELMLENSDHMLEELDVLIENLSQYRTAIQNNDFSDLRALLDDGRRIKEEVDGR
ncbi:MAG: prephenate dehydrogenase/arogenate dehydrogenase family protein [Oscillospiraceae bacterium]|nr:prephenate dehydrogenase/arogenate dehydrogenase family protein [Oscillospiraceae bacterium]